jgi:hypothetical protein
MKAIDIIRISVLIILLVTPIMIGAAYIGYEYGKPTYTLTARFIMGNTYSVRANVLNAEETGVEDILGAMERPEVILEMNDYRAALLLPGDRFIVRCRVDQGKELRFYECKLLPVINRGS